MRQSENEPVNEPVLRVEPQSPDERLEPLPQVGPEEPQETKPQRHGKNRGYKLEESDDPASDRNSAPKRFHELALLAIRREMLAALP